MTRMVVAIVSHMTDTSIQDYINAREALVQERALLVNKIADIDKALAKAGGSTGSATPVKGPKKGAKGRPKKKRTMSDEGRARISAAAKKRWAERKAQGKGKGSPKAKK